MGQITLSRTRRILESYYFQVVDYGYGYYSEIVGYTRIPNFVSVKISGNYFPFKKKVGWKNDSDFIFFLKFNYYRKRRFALRF